MTLASASNPLIKAVRRAVQRGELTAEGWAVAESAHLLAEALRSSVEIGTVLVSEAAESAVQQAGEAAGAPLRQVEASLFRQIASTENSRGLLALVRLPDWEFEQIAARPGPVAVLDGVQDPGNAGAIVRVAEAFGAAGAVFLRGSAAPFHPKTLRASAGSLFRLPFVSGWTPERLIDENGRAGFELVAAVARGGEALGSVELSRAAVAIGSEAHGVNDAILAQARRVSIPVVGVESLNAAVAAGVIFYEAGREGD